MIRQANVRAAFVSALKLNAKGLLCVRTLDFIAELRSKGIHFSESDANRWIERNQIGFVDKTPTEDENRLWLLRNMGRVI